MKNTAYKSFKTVSTIFKSLPAFDKWLPDHALYQGHIHPNKEEEPLIAHIELVNRYVERLCESHRLDVTIDQLLNDVLLQLDIDVYTEGVSDLAKEIFVLSVYAHDFGKVNENFQSQRLKNKAFKPIQSPLEYRHSQLGAYIYLALILKKVFELQLQDEEQATKLYYLALVMSYSIVRHHAPYFDRANADKICFEKDKQDECLRQLKKYQFHFEDIEQIHEIVSDTDEIFKQIELSSLSFPLFALSKLNFSLLTAADYLATHEYMSMKEGETLEDFGILTDELREKIFTKIRTSESYNTETFKKADEINTPSVSEPKTLNDLRQSMAVEVVNNTRLLSKERLFYIEAPTGGGKTNLSLLATAELLRLNPELNKVFYVFPFTTLITQTHKVVLKNFGLDENYVAELHSKAGFKEKTKEETEDGLYGDEKDDYIANLFGNFQITLLSHVRFFDVLKSNGKETNYWLHRMANSVVVIDEIQAYSPEIWDKMAYLLAEYSRYFNIRFIVMSATLPKFDELLTPNVYQKAKVEKPEFHKLIDDAKRYFQDPNFCKRVNFRFDLLEKPLFKSNGKGVTDDEKAVKLEILKNFVLEKSKERANKNDGRVFTIIEFIFKKTASAFAKIIGNQYFDEVFVLSGTILEHRRRYIINFLKKNKKAKNLKILLITTQVVEAGVDIDMDLGFKDTSLIDSDEQLAGRINRNVTKENCELYLFNLDPANMIYGKDKRYELIKNGQIETKEHKNILETKDFQGLYYKDVFKKIDERNQSQNIKNLSDYLWAMRRLDFSEVDKDFKIIDQQTTSVFVPLDIPIKIEGEDDDFDMIFSKNELIELEKVGVYEKDTPSVSGIKIFDFYKMLVHSKKEQQKIDFVKSRIDFKKLGGIMSKFCFSLMTNSKDVENLKAPFGKEEYGFIYLESYEGVYSIENGIDAEKFKDSNFI